MISDGIYPQLVQSRAQILSETQLECVLPEVSERFFLVFL